jgi:hypothetical protein
MKTRWAIFAMAVVLCAGLGYVSALECPSWDCTGQINCTEEMTDECRSDRDLFGYWTCNGSCWRSSVTGEVRECESPAGLFDTCYYDGAEACEGQVDRRDCETQEQFPPGSGSYCTGNCTGEWTLYYDPGVIINCT